MRFGLVLSCLFTAAWSAHSQSCQPIKQRPNDGSYVQDHGLTQPGRYCLKEDIFVKGHRSWAEGGRIFNVSKIIVNIGANDVVLDLDGHTAWSDGRLEAGIETTLADKQVPLKNPPKNITLRNGTLRLERRGIGIRFSGLGGLLGDKWPYSVASDFGEPKFSVTTTGEALEQAVKLAKEGHQSYITEFWGLLPSNPAAYPVRNLRIENMRIRTKDVAVVLQGAGTVIRDSIIEVDSGTALWLYGPDAVIENNTIIVNGRDTSDSPLREADAAIRLHHADGAVIRNNRIVIKGNAPKRIVSTFETGPFTLESNRFQGVTNKDVIAKAFRGTVQMKAIANVFEP
jgi:hypothetical protein